MLCLYQGGVIFLTLGIFDTFLSKKQVLLSFVDTSGIQVDVKTDFNTKDIKTVAAKRGLTDQKVASLFNAIESTTNADQTIAQIAETISLLTTQSAAIQV